MATESTPFSIVSSSSDELNFQNIPHGQAARYTIDDEEAAANATTHSQSLLASPRTMQQSNTSSSSSSSSSVSVAANSLLTEVALNMATSHFFGSSSSATSSTTSASSSSSLSDSFGAPTISNLTSSSGVASSSPSVSSSSSSSSAYFYQLAYYKPFFDLSSEDLLQRLLRSIFPLTRKPFYYDEDNKIDLYGPFWITTTLIIILAVTANLDDYIRVTFSNDSSSSDSTTPTSAPSGSSNTKSVDWNYNFNKVTAAAATFYFYLFVWALIVWFVLHRLQVNNRLAMSISLHGYSLISYIPTCILFLIRYNGWRWAILCVAFLFSSGFLIRNLAHHISESASPDGQQEQENLQNERVDDGEILTHETKQIQKFQAKALPVLVAILIANAVIAFAMKFYFFVDSS